VERFIFHHPKAYRHILTMGLVGVLMAGIGSIGTADQLAQSWADARPATRVELPAGQSVAEASATVRPAGWEAAQALPGADGSATATVAAPAATVAVQIAASTGDVLSLGRSLNAVQFGDQYWPSLQALWTRESNWNPAARNRRSGACGIPQALPCSKIPDMSPQGQIQWGLGYIKQRYGNPAAAWSFWQQHHWY
jgi:hypothetical protein